MKKLKIKSGHFLLPLAFVTMTLVLTGCFKDLEDPVQVRVTNELNAIKTKLELDGAPYQESENFKFYFNVTSALPSAAKPKVGDIVSVTYKLSTFDGDNDGKLIAESLDTPLLVGLGQNAIFPVAFELLINEMRIGETATGYFPSAFAYSSYSKSGLIDQYELLKLEVTVLSSESADRRKLTEDKLIRKYVEDNNLTGFTSKEVEGDVVWTKTKVEGSGDQVKSNDIVEVFYKGTLLDGTVFDSGNFSDSNGLSAVLGLESGESNVIRGWSLALPLFKKGAEGIIIIPSQTAYGVNTEVIPASVEAEWLSSRLLGRNRRWANAIPAYAPLVFEIKIQK